VGRGEWGEAETSGLVGRVGCVSVIGWWEGGGTGGAYEGEEGGWGVCDWVGGEGERGGFVGRGEMCEAGEVRRGRIRV